MQKKEAHSDQSFFSEKTSARKIFLRKHARAYTFGISYVSLIQPNLKPIQVSM